MDRQAQIKEEGCRLMQPVLYQSVRALLAAYKKEEESIVAAFSRKLEELYAMAGELQADGKKGSVAYLGIWFCNSSAYTGNYELRLELYDEEFYLDEVPCCIYWNPEFITSYLLEDIDYFKKEIRHVLPRVKTEEMQQFILEYMGDYMYVFSEFLRQKLPDIMASIQKGDTAVSEDFQILFGEYMGKYIIVKGQ